MEPSTIAALVQSLSIAAIAIAADAVDANPGYERLQSTGYLVKQLPGCFRWNGWIAWFHGRWLLRQQLRCVQQKARIRDDHGYDAREMLLARYGKRKGGTRD